MGLFNYILGLHFFGFTIIIFNSLEANLIFYGGLIIIFLVIVFMSPQNQKMDNSKTKPVWDTNDLNKNRFEPKSILIVNNELELTNALVDSYYQLESNINIESNYETTANDVIKILSNRRVFIFNNSFNCTTNSRTGFGKGTYINVKVKHSQGFRIFRAILDHRLENELNEQDLIVLARIRKVFGSIIKPEMTDFKKVVAIHNYLILTSRYDYDNYKNGTIPERSHTPYGLLFDHKAVCSAYAEVFMIFMALANIECYYVMGKLKNRNVNILNKDMGHAWNIIKIENYYYHVDVTLDNPIPDIIGRVNYRYLNVSDDVLGKTHIWNRSYYPICNSMRHRYYNMT